MHQHQRQHQQYGDSSADDYGEGEAHSGYLEGDYSNNDGSQRHASLPSLPPLSRGTSADASVGGGTLAQLSARYGLASSADSYAQVRCAALPA